MRVSPHVQAAKNFLKLCKIKYYNNCIVHDVKKDFIFQTGDPTGTGQGSIAPAQMCFSCHVELIRSNHQVAIVSMDSSMALRYPHQFLLVTDCALNVCCYCQARFFPGEISKKNKHKLRLMR